MLQTITAVLLGCGGVIGAAVGFNPPTDAQVLAKLQVGVEENVAIVKELVAVRVAGVQWAGGKLTPRDLLARWECSAYYHDVSVVNGKVVRTPRLKVVRIETATAGK